MRRVLVSTGQASLSLKVCKTHRQRGLSDLCLCSVWSSSFLSPTVFLSLTGNSLKWLHLWSIASFCPASLVLFQSTLGGLLEIPKTHQSRVSWYYLFLPIVCYSHHFGICFQVSLWKFNSVSYVHVDISTGIEDS